jgi:hypothetical protein
MIIKQDLGVHKDVTQLIFGSGDIIFSTGQMPFHEREQSLIFAQSYKKPIGEESDEFKGKTSDAMADVRCVFHFEKAESIKVVIEALNELYEKMTTEPNVNGSVATKLKEEPKLETKEQEINPNRLFEGSQPLPADMQNILNETFRKQLKSEPTNRLARATKSSEGITDVSAEAEYVIEVALNAQQASRKLSAIKTRKGNCLEDAIKKHYANHGSDILRIYEVEPSTRIAELEAEVKDAKQSEYYTRVAWDMSNAKKEALRTENTSLKQRLEAAIAHFDYLPSNQYFTAQEVTNYLVEHFQSERPEALQQPNLTGIGLFFNWIDKKEFPFEDGSFLKYNGTTDKDEPVTLSELYQMFLSEAPHSPSLKNNLED